MAGRVGGRYPHRGAWATWSPRSAGRGAGQGWAVSGRCIANPAERDRETVSPEEGGQVGCRHEGLEREIEVQGRAHPQRHTFKHFKGMFTAQLTQEEDVMVFLSVTGPDRFVALHRRYESSSRKVQITYHSRQDISSSGLSDTLTGYLIRNSISALYFRSKGSDRLLWLGERERERDPISSCGCRRPAAGS